MIHPIVKYGDEVLALKSAPITAFDGDLQKLIDDMFESMYAAQGVGLAAPQPQGSRRSCALISFRSSGKRLLFT